MEASVHTYVDNLIEWSFIVKGQDETKAILESKNGVVNLMTEYNAAYQSFFEKFMDLNRDAKEAFNHALMIKIYYGIKKNDLLEKENKAIKLLTASL